MSKRNFQCRIVPGTWLATLAPSCAKYRWVSSTEPCGGPRSVLECHTSNLASKPFQHFVWTSLWCLRDAHLTRHFTFTLNYFTWSSWLFGPWKFLLVKRGSKKTRKTYENIEKQFLHWAKLKSGFLQVLQAHLTTLMSAQLPSEVITTKDSGVTSDLELRIVQTLQVGGHSQGRIAKQTMAA